MSTSAACRDAAAQAPGARGDAASSSMAHPCDGSEQSQGMIKWLFERGLEFGGVLSAGDADGGASTSDSDTTANHSGWAAVGVDCDAVVVLPFEDQSAAAAAAAAAATAPFDSITAGPCYCSGCGGGNGGDGDGGEPGCCCYRCGSDSYPLPTAEVVSAVGLAEEALPHAGVFAVPPSTAAAAAAASDVGGRGAGTGSFAPLRALPIGEDALPPEARPPWELAAAFKLVACERVLPSARRAAVIPLRPSPTPSRKRKAAPPGGRRRGSASSHAEQGKASSAWGQAGAWGGRG